MKKIKSIKSRLFIVLCTTIITIIVFLILANNVILEEYYIYSKQQKLLKAYIEINNYYNSQTEIGNIELELEKIAINNNFDILIKTESNTNIYISNRDFISNIKSQIIESKNILYSTDKINIKKTANFSNGLTYILLTGKLDNGYLLYIRMPVSLIQESVRISNHFLYLIGGIALCISGIVVLIITRRFTNPILELNSIANKMSKLDFSHKYRIKDTDDEINNLGKSINLMSDELEKTIKQLKETNIELEKDIEKKSKIDEMRKQFISDVSHELKTPISLIQGYAEGLIENVVTDEGSKKEYANVILDEANKMDSLVKQLLELMKLEYGNREFNNQNFNISELIKETIRKSKLILEENKIEVQFDIIEPLCVYADEFYIEQVVNNYFTNALKHVKEVNNQKIIKISYKIKENGKIRITIFNTGEQIKEENINRIWNRFYKADESRTREDGGTGIGLSIVKAIMNNYKNEYGVENKENGVEFYFELDETNSKKC